MFLGIVLIPANPTFAQSNDPIYYLRIGAFLSDETTDDAVQKIKDETGWWMRTERTERFEEYYRVLSGGFYGEENVKNVLNDFKQKTGLDATYEPLGPGIPYQQIFSGSYYGEETVNRVVEEFISETGINASYQQNSSKGVKRKRIFSGAYYGEETVKNVINDFQNTTGITATYEVTGSPRETYKIETGGFYGEENVKSVLYDFQLNTGINGTYEPVSFNAIYEIRTGAFYGEENVKDVINQLESNFGVNPSYEESATEKYHYHITIPNLSGKKLSDVETFFKVNNWWYTKYQTDKIPTHFKILSEELYDKNKIKTGLQYFQSRNWWVTSKKTGNKVYVYFNIFTESLLDSKKLENALSFFKERNYWARIESTDEISYPYYDIITEPIHEQKGIEKASSFFKSRGYWFTIKNTGEYKYTHYRIRVDDLLGNTKKDRALNYFKDRNWWSQAVKIGEKEYYYYIITGHMTYNNAVNGKQMLSDKFGWWSQILKVDPPVKKTHYNITLEQALNIQMKVAPQTDKYRNEPAYVSANYVETYGLISGTNVNLRSSPSLSGSRRYQVGKDTRFEILDDNVKGDMYNNSTRWYKIRYKGETLYVHGSLANLYAKTTANVNIRERGSTSSHIYGVANKGSTLRLLELGENWHKISYNAWRNAKREDVKYYLDPNNFVNDPIQKYQFLDISKPSGVSLETLKNLLNGKGILHGKEKYFLQAEKEYGLNAVYLVAHALLETGDGNSELANGVEYNGKKVYNMYGINAVDSNPRGKGAEYAYNRGWFTPEAAIVGGAKWIADNYVYVGQNTIYSMRWNPYSMSSKGYASHQYATDIGWAYKQASLMYPIFNKVDTSHHRFDIPVYK